MRRPSTSRSRTPSGTLDLWAAPIGGGRARRLTSFSRDTYAPTVSSDGSVLFKVQSYRTVVALVAAAGGPTRAARDLPKRNAVVGSGRPAARHHLRHVAPRRGRCALSGHRAGRGDHRRRSGEAGDADVERRARVGVRGSGAVLVAERQVDRVPLAQGSVRRHLAAAGGRATRRRGASVFSGAAPRSAGRAGRRTASGCCSTAPARRRTGR